jgi:hypothetical protein
MNLTIASINSELSEFVNISVTNQDAISPVCTIETA